ncbi:MAG: hypothetical protein O3B13_20720 [Planctomycetota bacterium]|nr:hypothetical protein [Planctomycetota bacterium]
MATSQQAIEQLHASPWKIALCVTGGGSRICGDLLTVPGASNTILEITIPYSSAALTEFLGGIPDQFCSRETALRMASVAWRRAMNFATSDEASAKYCMGVSCTASLVSSRPKRSEHRLWIAIESAIGSRVVSLTLIKEIRSREEEEAVAAGLLLSTICEACQLDTPTLPPLAANETVTVETEFLPGLIAELRSNDQPVVWSLPDGQLTRTIAKHPRGMLSGSFNPLHQGHRRLQAVAAEQLEGPVYFELPIINADKPALDAFAIERRRRQFEETPVALTATPKFVDKAGLFPGTTFVIGYDTAVRIIQPRFYCGSEQAMRDSLKAIGALGCRFLVAGRLTDSGFHSIDELPLPADFQNLFSAIPERNFREDISSSQLRKAARRS